MTNYRSTVWVVAAAIVNAQGMVLMQRRRLDRDHGGLWEFPGGKVEPAETPAQSLCREIAEELGLTIVPADLTPVSFAAGADGPHVILLYLCRDWSGEPACLDGEEIAWFAPTDIPGLDLLPLDIPLAQALLNQIKR
ncbi:MAG: (deoxy)nucleoside triphosphate pyrophosphohydrolase [Alphaproteobacteria bacterium]|jgi:8-oxo-dGTP diphosphatase